MRVCPKDVVICWCVFAFQAAFFLSSFNSTVSRTVVCWCFNSYTSPNASRQRNPSPLRTARRLAYDVCMLRPLVAGGCWICAVRSPVVRVVVFQRGAVFLYGTAGVVGAGEVWPCLRVLCWLMRRHAPCTGPSVGHGVLCGLLWRPHARCSWAAVCFNRGTHAS